ncbi:MAG: fibronectin type III domain-containing protein [Clostridia bacterium]|nr:fibronectin type III domain-containing protein [Clostridia bacterium]
MKVIKKSLVLVLVLLMLFSSVGAAECFSTVVNAASASTGYVLKQEDTKTNSIKLSWKATKGATGYRLYKYNTKTKAYAKVVTTTKTSYTVRGLSAGEVYTFKLRPYTKSGSKVNWGKFYEPFEAMTRPAKVTGVDFVPLSTKTAKLSWDKVSGASGYRVYRYDAKTNEWTKIRTLTATSTQINNMKSGTAYVFSVRAYKKLNGRTLFGSASDSITITSELSDVVIKKAVPAETSVALSWDKTKGADGYLIHYSLYSNYGNKKSVNVSGGTTVGKTLKNLENGKTYYIRIKAYKEVSGKKVYSDKWSERRVRVDKIENLDELIGVYESKNLPSKHFMYDNKCAAWISIYTTENDSKYVSEIKKEFKAAFGYEAQEEVNCEYVGDFYIEGYEEAQSVYQYSIEDYTYDLFVDEFYELSYCVTLDGCPWVGFCILESEEVDYEAKSRLFTEMRYYFFEISGYDEDYRIAHEDNFSYPYNVIWSGPYRTKDGKIIKQIGWYFIRGYDVPFNKDTVCPACGEAVPEGTFHMMRDCKQFNDPVFRQEYLESLVK